MYTINVLLYWMLVLTSVYFYNKKNIVLGLVLLVVSTYFGKDLY